MWILTRQRRDSMFSKKNSPHSLPSFISFRKLVLFFIFFIAAGFLYFSYSTPPSSTLSPISGCIDVNRSSYAVSPLVFASLPSPPACLISSSRAFVSRQFSDASFFSPDYFLQPEFYPTFFSEGLPKWTLPTPQTMGVIGYGAFPHYDRLVVLPGESKSIRFFFHSSFGVRSFQEGRLLIQFARPADENALIISLDKNASSGFGVGPTFPIFHPSWVKPVDINVFRPLSSRETIWITLVTAPPSSEYSSSAPPSSVSYGFTDFIGSRLVYTLEIRSG